jgi:hypothetical protein
LSDRPRSAGPWQALDRQFRRRVENTSLRGGPTRETTTRFDRRRRGGDLNSNSQRAIPKVARARLLKPGFFKNEDLAELGPFHRLLFAGLWTIADREGRLHDRAFWIKVEVLPYDTFTPTEIDEMLSDLQRAGFIRRYTVGGRRLIQIAAFLKHQSPHFKEPASELPGPRGHKDTPIVAFGVSAEQRKRILARDRHRCVKCGAGIRLSIDHVVPVSKGGTNDDANLQTLCKKCNCKKGNRLEPQKNADGTGDSSAMHGPTPPGSSRAVPETESVPVPESVPVGVAEAGSGSGSGDGSKSSAAPSASRPPTETRTNGTPEGNYGVIVKLVHEVLNTFGTGISDVDLREEVKCRCAAPSVAIAYDSTVIARAIDSARHQRVSH